MAAASDYRKRHWAQVLAPKQPPAPKPGSIDELLDHENEAAYQTRWSVGRPHASAMTRITKFITGGVVIVLLLPIFLTTYYRGVRHYSLTDSLYSGFLGWTTDTSWAKGYSERNFAKVRVGMTQDEVRGIMGDPIWKPNPDYWGYTWSPSSTHYQQRGVVFSPSGSVTQIVKGFYFD